MSIELTRLEHVPPACTCRGQRTMKGVLIPLSYTVVLQRGNGRPLSLMKHDQRVFGQPTTVEFVEHCAHVVVQPADGVVVESQILPRLGHVGQIRRHHHLSRVVRRIGRRRA